MGAPHVLQAAAPAAKPPTAAAAAPAPEQLTEQETRDTAYEIVSELWGLNGRAAPNPEGAIQFLRVRAKGQECEGQGQVSYQGSGLSCEVLRKTKGS